MFENTTQIYLAGAIEAAPDGGAKWRLEITPALTQIGLSVFNPCLTTDGLLASKLGWENFSVDKWTKLKETKPDLCQQIGRWLVKEDLKNIKDSEILLVYFDKYVTLGAGTYGEITVARFLNMPVYIVVAPEFDSHKIPLWILGCVSNIFESFEDFITYYKELS